MIFYNFIKLLLRLAVDLFFDEVEVRHAEHVPKQGPLIIAANHPSSIMDAMILGVKTPRKIHYIGHAGLFSNFVKRKFLYAMGIIPVYRKEENPEQMDKNVDMFRAAYKILEDGKCIGIFPEGTSQTGRKVHKLKTGMARIALGAEKQNDFALGLSIVPLGLYFTARHRFRSNVLLNFGKPITVSDYRDDYENDEYEGVHTLTERISDELGKLTLNIKKDGLNDFVTDLEKIYRAGLKSDLEEEEILISDDEVFKDMFLSQQLADAVEYYMETKPDEVIALMKEVKNYRLKLDRLQLHDSMLQSDTKSAKVRKRSWKVAFWGVIGFPVWVAGVITNYIPYKFAEQLGKKIGYDKTKTSSVLMIGGGLGFIIYYAIETYVIWTNFGLIPGLLFLVSVPFLGFGALAYRRKLKQRWRMWSFSITLLTNRHIIKKLQLERRSLLRRLDEFKEDYLKVINQQG
ncbi:MAG: 1-acyl-sn-glycerol-3-phosphate acyltransferase [Candidatus Marinimicrobia bacterium]|nr:1-acyl-sn-glycerol-3-phosphate acyltransferase [Candidatus Neomarinimicrobiota bacterium]